MDIEEIEYEEGVGFLGSGYDYDEDFYEEPDFFEEQEYLPGYKELESISFGGPCAPLGDETLESKIARTDREKQIYKVRESLYSRFYINFSDDEKMAACLLVEKINTDIDLLNAKVLAASAIYVSKYGKKLNAVHLKSFIETTGGLKDPLEKVNYLDLIRYLKMLEKFWE